MVEYKLSVPASEGRCNRSKLLAVYSLHPMMAVTYIKTTENRACLERYKSLFFFFFL